VFALQSRRHVAGFRIDAGGYLDLWHRMLCADTSGIAADCAQPVPEHMACQRQRGTVGEMADVLHWAGDRTVSDGKRARAENSISAAWKTTRLPAQKT
jgi:hypothetical protein